MKKFLILLLPILFLSVSCVNENLSEEQQEDIIIDEYMKSIEHLRTELAPVMDINAVKMKCISPNDEIAASYPTNMEKGEIILDDKRTVKWILHYNRIEKKPFDFGIMIEGEDLQNVSNGTSKRLPLGFFIGVKDCLDDDNGSNLNPCIRTLLVTTIADCEKYDNCEHCWWRSGC